MPEPSPHREEIIRALRAGEPIGEVANRVPVSRRTVERYAKQMKEGKLEEKVKPPKEREGGKLVTFVAKQPAPVIFVLGKSEIELDPQAIYESFLLYEDMKLKCGLTDGFSSVLLDGVGLLWRILASEPQN